MWKESSHKSYRPLTVISFRINYYFSQLAPQSYHITNAVLHAIASVLVWKLATLFFTSNLSCFLVGVLFAVHSIHTEAVSFTMLRFYRQFILYK
jgi:hypothetical protein